MTIFSNYCSNFYLPMNNLFMPVLSVPKDFSWFYSFEIPKLEMPKIDFFFQNNTIPFIPVQSSVYNYQPVFNTNNLNPALSFPSVLTNLEKTNMSSLKNNSALNISNKYSINDKKIDNSYLHLSQKQAEEKAKKDSNLELLKGGKNWSVSNKSFVTDIPYAKKGTGAILDKVATMIGEKLVITSALGTGESGNPHQKSGYESHHNAENPKLDIRIRGNGKELANKLKSTGYFSRVSTEKDHLDVQIDITKFKDFEAIA